VLIAQQHQQQAAAQHQQQARLQQQMAFTQAGFMQVRVAVMPGVSGKGLPC
jgi:hypothetical protein